MQISRSLPSRQTTQATWRVKFRSAQKLLAGCSQRYQWLCIMVKRKKEIIACFKSKDLVIIRDTSFIETDVSHVKDVFDVTDVKISPLIIVFSTKNE